MKSKSSIVTLCMHDVVCVSLCVFYNLDICRRALFAACVMLAHMCT